MVIATLTVAIHNGSVFVSSQAQLVLKISCVRFAMKLFNYSVLKNIIPICIRITNLKIETVHLWNILLVTKPTTYKMQTSKSNLVESSYLFFKASQRRAPWCQNLILHLSRIRGSFSQNKNCFRCAMHF